jgi:hypothetical protein
MISTVPAGSAAWCWSTLLVAALAPAAPKVMIKAAGQVRSDPKILLKFMI